MLTLAYSAFALAMVVLAALAIRRFAARPGAGTFTLALPIALLVWDNSVVALGSLLGEGPLLLALSWPRFVGHAFLTPIWIVTAFEFARLASKGTAASDAAPPEAASLDPTPRGPTGQRNRVWLLAGWLLYALMAALGFVKSVLLLDLAPVRQLDILYYTNVGGFPGPPIPALVMVIVVIVAGALVWKRRGWPWMLAGGLAMFVAAAVPTRLVGFWLSNTGEVLLSAALVATAGRLAPRPSGAGTSVRQVGVEGR
jgi:hypothetical protein